MKCSYIILLLLLVIKCSTEAQQLAQPFMTQTFTAPKSEGICMTEAEKAMYNREAMAASLRWKSRTDSVFASQGTNTGKLTQVYFRWPMKIADSYDMQYKFYYKVNFVDQAGPSNILDYNCGSRTYNGHDAMDASLWPFWWRMMDNLHVYAVAAAPGVIITKVDSIYDRRCNSDYPGSNRIFIRHADGTTSRYHHLKNGGLTNKIEGDTVVAGEFLGYIASSGSSSHPHLHFAVYDVNGALVEPFFVNTVDPCNVYSSSTWWQSQPAYWDAKISRVMTHSQPPVVADCSDDEKVYAKNNFGPADNVYIGVYFSESLYFETATCRIYYPDGSLFASYNITTIQDNYSYNLHGYTNLLVPGTWKIKVTYRNTDYYHFFSVSCTSSINPSGTDSGPQGYIAGSSISSTVNHSIAAGDRVLYQAGTTIEFKPGFHAPAGIELKARLKPCNYAE